ncbi:hypothetical protein LSAT2_027278, partial [Lamellibrachia satsuma]
MDPTRKRKKFLCSDDTEVPKRTKHRWDTRHCQANVNDPGADEVGLELEDTDTVTASFSVSNSDADICRETVGEIHNGDNGNINGSDNETTVHPLEEDDIHIIHEVYFHEGYPDATEVLAGNMFD